MAQVVPFSAEIDSLNTNIVAVSFGTPQWVDAWLQVTGAQFPVWLDDSKQSYAAYQLTHRERASWSAKNLWYYARALARGEQLQGYRGDINQLGGNFIVDRHGMVRFAHPSQDPTDRPAVEEMLTVLRTLEAE